MVDSMCVAAERRVEESCAVPDAGTMVTPRDSWPPALRWGGLVVTRTCPVDDGATTHMLASPRLQAELRRAMESRGVSATQLSPRPTLARDE